MRTRVLAVIVAAGVAAACSDYPAPTQPTSVTVPVQFSSAARADQAHSHGAHMTGAAEWPVPNDSRAQGQANFKVSDDGSEIRFKLMVANIENVTQSHIHCCAGTEGNAGIVVWLYPAAPPAQLIPGRSQGVLAEGVITRSSLVGILAGEPLSVLLDRIQSGLAYVNVHTTQFPPGEIRGQMQ
jgi:hypothetical protein